MKDFCQLSGPWAGLSTQEGRRIPECIQLRINRSHIVGTGSDADGLFELDGNFDPETKRVTMTRRYTVTSQPAQEGVGIPFHYDGVWDGEMVAGRWHCRPSPMDQGDFEMWPDREEDRQELMIELHELSHAGN
ncbi:MAG: hypothetical protein IT206_08880 [Fimbriimonadaceae bacterium]|nr:hypothetical protein [Fimbriimonadaceae bacterium]